MMRDHTWETEYVDGGMLDGHFWKCPSCGASGGIVCEGHSPPTLGPFYADGSGLQVSTDCDEAKSQIQEHLKTWVPWDKRPVEPPPGVKVGPVQPGLTQGDLAGFEARTREMADLGYQLWGTKGEHLDETRMADFEAHCKAEVAARDAARAVEVAERARQHEDWLAAGGRYNGG